ncbi:MAG: phosphoenolpyruvate carboxykinase, partial [Deltaproteobacteria bacterium]
KDYTKELYTKQFSLYLDNILKRVELQQDAYSKEENIPKALFEILAQQKQELLKFKNAHGSIVVPDLF